MLVDIVPDAIAIICSVYILFMLCMCYVLEDSTESLDPLSLDCSRIIDSVFIGTISSQFEYVWSPIWIAVFDML